ncbi:hypothetical protein LZ32DRAFT_159406 [Colletotrichum eremochloae]|nr:hypothetical protein LZ32DRAFT_159406 [Colletotrichum eremochloae]
MGKCPDYFKISLIFGLISSISTSVGTNLELESVFAARHLCSRPCSCSLRRGPAPNDRELTREDLLIFPSTNRDSSHHSTQI